MTAAHQPKPPREIWVCHHEGKRPFGITIAHYDAYERREMAEPHPFWAEMNAGKFEVVRYVLAPAAKPRRKRKKGER